MFALTFKVVVRLKDSMSPNRI